MSTVTIRRVTLPGDDTRKPRSTRGIILHFSRKSRKRMCDKLARKRDYLRPLFLTLTYPDEAWFGMGKTYDDLQKDLEAFLQRFRRAFPDAGLIWRKEEEDRKSGDYVGTVVPHLHMMIDGLLQDVDELRKLFREWWMEIITDHQPELLVKGCRVDLQVAKSRRHAMYYVSKYVAKQTNIDNKKEKKSNKKVDYAELWQQEIDMRAAQEEDNSDETQDNSDLCQPVDNMGRIWGVIGNWNTTEAITVKITYKQYVQWKRLVSRWMKSKGSRYARSLGRMPSNVGFSVYGLGDLSSVVYESVYESAIFRSLLHAFDLA